jgi:CRP-like cAMP-binding protein
MKICRHLKPHICIINEHVFYKDSAALRLFFINEGVCEIVASDEKTLLRFMSKGTFFGEIGCFLTGKRTCSVIVRTTTILHAIRKEPLLSILDEYPAQLKYLQQVSKQRMEKVHP